MSKGMLTGVFNTAHLNFYIMLVANQTLTWRVK